MSLLPVTTHIGRVTLRVASLERSLGFYRDLLGMTVLDERHDEVSGTSVSCRGTLRPRRRFWNCTKCVASGRYRLKA